MGTLFTIGVAYFLNTVSSTDERLSQDFAASTTGIPPFENQIQLAQLLSHYRLLVYTC